MEAIISFAIHYMRVHCLHSGNNALQFLDAISKGLLDIQIVHSLQSTKNFLLHQSFRCCQTILIPLHVFSAHGSILSFVHMIIL